jgi:subtilisin family serine protease
MVKDIKEEKSSKLSLENRKIDPRLRLLANCDLEVCKERAQTDAALVVGAEVTLTTEALIKSSRQTSDQKRKAVRDKASIDEPISSAKVSVFVNLSDDSDLLPLDETAPKPSVRGKVQTIEVPLNKIGKIALLPDVVSIEVGERIKVPPVILSQDAGQAKRPTLSERKITVESAKHRYGADVLIGIIDVGGIAFAHEDFLDENGLTRIERIWDMGGNHRLKPVSHDYGAEFKKEHLNAAITTSKAIGVSPYAIEKQRHQIPGSHATHVASIAAGNRGICRNASIACVMLDLPADELDRRRSFYDSARIAHALDYLIDVAKDLGGEDGPIPLAVNISLGTNGHAHDGSSAASRWIDNALAVPGRAVCVAAGNSGQEAPAYPGDLGYVTGRIHSSGQIKNKGLTNTMEWIVVGDGIADISENEMEIWYEPQDRFSVTVETPGPNSIKIGPVKPGQYIENRQLSDGTLVSIYNELYRPVNGCNTISIYLTPFLKDPLMGIESGLWRVSITGEDVRDGRYHAWIERDDPKIRIKRSGTNFASYPSFFSERSNVDSNSVSSLACGERIVSVGNYDAAQRTVNISSSQGPTRTGNNKPEILAPGTDIVAANGFVGDDDSWIGMTGTSMASPHAAGAAGLMLGTRNTLSAAQVLGIMRRTASPVENSDFSWKNDTGFGLLNVASCVREARNIDTYDDIT